LDYGGRDEIVRVVNKLLKQGKNEITEEEICKHLDTFDIPDPDLIIRTSGEQRTSGLLPWQSTYSELYFADVYFPDFDVKEFKKSIEEFSKRKRTFGGN
jgi:undecaprenyl diphosphate synthase